VQREPRLIESIKSVYDQFGQTRYILLGSSQFLLLQKVKESLAGRCIIFEIYPLTLPEMLTSGWECEVKKSYFQHLISENAPDLKLMPSLLLHPDHPVILEKFDHYLKFGGYPALINPGVRDSERREWLSNYIRTYLERDVRDLADFRNLEPFVRTQQTAALLTGQTVNFTQLAKEAGISSNTAKKFLTYLEISYQAILLKSWQKTG
jgi:predicted AAA+ superfamily ATPase